MSDTSNLKINESSNVEQPILRDTTIENENWESLKHRKKIERIGTISSGTECREIFQNFQVVKFWNFFYFPILFKKFLKFKIWKTNRFPKML